MLWHERLGHSNIKVIKHMVKEKLIEGCDELHGQEQKCDACIISKNTRSTYPRLKHIRSKNILDLIHTDVWGPAPVASRNGQRYLLTFIDDYSRRSFCYPLKSKDEVPSQVQHFITFIERQTGLKVRMFRTDNGLEYCNQILNNLFRKLGIKHEHTSPYSPQQNGVAERFNRVLFEGVRTFTEVAKLPGKLWVEAAMATNYIRNRILHTGIDAIPFERWYKQKPSIRHLKRYGCVAYVHQHPPLRNKFQPRAKRGVFVGYGLGSSGYRVWFPKENKIVESKHVTFDEAQIGNFQENRLLHNAIHDFDIIPDTSNLPFSNLDTTLQPSTSSTLTAAEVEEKEKGQVTYLIDEKPLKKEPDSSDESETELEKNEEKDDDETSSSGSFETTYDDDDDESNELTFTRIISTRAKGATAGKKDIYIITPTGQRLRSGKSLKKYCEEHKLKYDKSLAYFSKFNEYQGPIVFERITLTDEANLTEVIIPKSPQHAKTLPQAKYWVEAMDQEISTMLDRNVWTPVPFSSELKVIGTRWVYTVKKHPNGEIHTYKARLVALGNNQREGLDYEETFSPVINFSIIRLIVAMFSMVFKWVNTLLDVKCAYLYGNIDKEIYIKQPADYIIPGKETHILKLNKAIYGLHQAGRCWFHDLHSKLIKNEFKEVPGVSCVYIYKGKAIILVYVDDLAIFAKDEHALQEVVHKIESIYQVKNLGVIHTLLGISFKTDQGNFKNVNCATYIKKCMQKFQANSLSRISLPASPGYVPALPRTEEEELPENIPFRSLLGSLQYICHRCRPDIAWTVHAIAQFTEKPSREHFRVLLRTLMYLSNTADLGIKLQPSKPPLQLVIYVDASWGSDLEDRKSWSSYIILLNDMPIQWRISKQTCIALSPMEAEFIAASEAAKDIKFISSSIQEILKLIPSLIPTSFVQKPLLLCDNTAAIAFTKNPADNVRNRHIDMKYKFVRDFYEQGLFDILHVSSKENLADLLTKSLSKDQFLRLRDFILC